MYPSNPPAPAPVQNPPPPPPLFPPHEALPVPPVKFGWNPGGGGAAFGLEKLSPPG